MAVMASSQRRSSRRINDINLRNDTLSNTKQQKQQKKQHPHGNKRKLSHNTSTAASDAITTLVTNIPSHYIQDLQHPSNNDDSSTIQQRLITKTRETLRRLNSKTTHGQRLCPADSEEARSAVVLQFVLRRGFSLDESTNNPSSSSSSSARSAMSPSIRRPLSVLGKIVGIGRKDIEKVGKVCALYLESMDYSSHQNNDCSSHNRNGKRLRGSSSIHSRNNDNGRESSSASLLGKYSNVHERNAARMISLGMKQRNSALAKSNTNKHNITTTIPTSKRRTKRNNHHSIIPNSTNSFQKQTKKPSSLLSSKHLSNLCMKLSSCLHDPNTIEIKSKLLWLNLITYKLQSSQQTINIKNKNNNNNTHLENVIFSDLHSHQTHYEGACFYVTVIDLEHGTLFSKNGKNYNNHNPNHCHNMNHDDDDQQDEHVLSIEQIIHELRIDESIFSDILDEVITSVQCMGYRRYHCSGKHSNYDDNGDDDKLIQDFNGQKHDSSKDVDSDWSTNQSVIMSSLKKQTKISGDHEISTSRNPNQQTISRPYRRSIDDIDVNHHHHQPSNGKARYVNEKQFLEWKNSTISSLTSNNSIISVKDSNISSSLDESMNSAKIIKLHAQEILNRYRNESSSLN